VEILQELGVQNATRTDLIHVQNICEAVTTRAASVAAAGIGYYILEAEAVLGGGPKVKARTKYEVRVASPSYKKMKGTF